MKRKLNIFLSRYKKIWPFLFKINQIVFNWNDREHHKRFGKLNQDVKFYVMRSSGTFIGILSYYLGALDTLCMCERENLVLIVDFLNYKTQNSVDFPINGTCNAWEYYFEQPCKYTLDEVYQSRNVVLSGWKITPPHEQKITEEEMYQAMQKIPVKKYIRDIADKKIKTEGINNMIGVLVRGTDYVRLKPNGHSIPPTPQQAAEKLDEFLEKYGKSRVFLATEDAGIYDYFVRRYGDMIYTSDNCVNLLSDYSGDYIEKEIGSMNKYKFGLDYIVKMICLSECKCLISSRTAGSMFARLLNHGRYTEYYLFDLGVY